MTDNYIDFKERFALLEKIEDQKKFLFNFGEIIRFLEKDPAFKSFIDENFPTTPNKTSNTPGVGDILVELFNIYESRPSFTDAKVSSFRIVEVPNIKGLRKLSKERPLPEERFISQKEETRQRKAITEGLSTLLPFLKECTKKQTEPPKVQFNASAKSYNKKDCIIDIGGCKIDITEGTRQERVVRALFSSKFRGKKIKAFELYETVNNVDFYEKNKDGKERTVKETRISAEQKIRDDIRLINTKIIKATGIQDLLIKREKNHYWIPKN